MPKTAAAKRSNQSNANFDLLFGIEAGPQQISGLMLLARSVIQVAPQARTRFPKEEISELAASIRELRAVSQGIEGTGLLQPLLVRPSESGIYTLIAGERRLRAAEEAGVDELPCLVTNASEEVVPLLQIVENLQRVGLHPLDEARGIEMLMKARSLTVRQASQLLGKDKNYVSNRLRLLKMKPDVQEMVSRRADTLVHAQLLDDVTDDKKRVQLIQAVTDKSLSVAELRRRTEGKTESKVRSEDEPHIETNHHGASVLGTASDAASNESVLSLRRDKSGVVETRIARQERDSAPQRNVTPGEELGKEQREEFVKNQTPDPLATAIQPAEALLAEAARQLDEMKPGGEYAERVVAALDAMKERIVAIEKSMRRKTKH